MPVGKIIREKAYAKINLALKILGERDDGYHEVSMVLQSVGLADKIAISAAAPEKALPTVSVKGCPELAGDASNLAYRAALLLARHTGQKANVHIELEKNIWLAAGLAGGSSDAAAVLRGLNRYWRLQLPQTELERLAAELGSDVPFCIAGGTAIARGRGDKLWPLADLATTALVLAKPRQLKINTAWAYSNYQSGRVVNQPRIWAIEDRLAQGPRALRPYMGNVLESVSIPAHPIIAQIKAALLGSGAYFAMMSGSGPCVFALTEDLKTARRAARALAAFDVDLAITTTVRRYFP